MADKLKTYSHKTCIQVEHAINDILFEADIGRYKHNYPAIHFFGNRHIPLPFPTFSNSSTISSISCRTPMSYCDIYKDEHVLKLVITKFFFH